MQSGRICALCGLFALVSVGCSLKLEPEPQVVRPIYDLSEGDIPMANDLVRDEELGRLDLPTDASDLTEAEVEFYEQLNTMDGWPSTFQQKVEFTGTVADDTVSESTVQVWRWGTDPERETDVTIALHRAGTELTIDPPRTGWMAGTRYVVMIRGGEEGIRGGLNEPVVPDPSFFYVRSDQQLDDPEHIWAFPGDTREERMQTARDLEEVRQKLIPYFDYFDSIGYPREEIVVLWTFTVTAHPELAMDETSQRMPLPINLLIDPATDRVDLPISPDDSELRAEVKRQVNGLDGFALSANLLFESTRTLEPATVSSDQIKLYELGGVPREIPVDAWLMPDGIHVVVQPQESPLKEQTTYAVVVYDGIESLDGSPLKPMPAGMFLRATLPIYADGHSQVGSLDDLQAERLEIVRSEVAPLLDQMGRDHVVTAWTFRTQSVLEPMLEATNKAEELNISPEPSNLEVMTPGEALLDFVIGIASLFDVEEIWNGTIKTPVFLDRVTRGMTEDGSHQVEEIAFQLTIPRNWDPNVPLPVVIFGHGLMTERRFVLSQGDFLARRGFAAIAIDLPYHGTRTFCKRGGPMSIPHPLTGELIDLDPCENNTTCAADGRCVDGQGQGNALRMWPIIGYPMASGSAFLEMEELAHTRDHFTQGLIDLRSLLRALQSADWQSAIGYQFATDRFYYIGQSLGGILGAVFTTISPEVERAVWNVPGCDMVDMFDTSIYFGPQVDAFFQREDVNRTSYDAELFLNVARWIMDAIDPASVAHLMQGSTRKVLIQMATLDFIIPNWTTEKLRDISGAPMREYVSEHAFLTIPGDPAYLPGVIDAADFIDGVFDR